MKLRTHYIIAKIAADHAELSFLERSVFCIGSLIPDLSPVQFIHPHFYAKSAAYVKDKLEQADGRRRLSKLFTYGKMAHYASDFCCSVHFSGGIGNVHQHIVYERKLNRYARSNKAALRKELADVEVRQGLKAILSGYGSSEKFDFHTDMSFAIRCCISLCERAYGADDAFAPVSLKGAYTV